MLRPISNLFFLSDHNRDLIDGLIDLFLAVDACIDPTVIEKFGLMDIACRLLPIKFVVRASGMHDDGFLGGGKETLRFTLSWKGEITISPIGVIPFFKTGRHSAALSAAPTLGGY